MRRIILGIGLLALGTGWILLTLYLFWWGPWQKQNFASRVAGLIYAPGPIILIGDSIFQPLEGGCQRVINLAVPGASTSDVPRRLLDSLSYQEPSAIVVLLGINDLRAGATPADVVKRLVKLANELKRSASSARVTIISLLPIVENEVALQATNLKILETNRILAQSANNETYEFIDISQRFGNMALRHELTYDGLHLNAAGSAELKTLLFSGVAGRRSVGAGCVTDQG